MCTCSVQSALFSGINDDFICDKVEKKSQKAATLRHVYLHNILKSLQAHMLVIELKSTKVTWFCYGKYVHVHACVK